MSFMPRRFRRSGIEDELRRARPEPPAGLVRTLQARVRHDRTSPRYGRLRLGFAGVLTAGMLAAVAAFGGIGYAATGAGHVLSAAGNIVQLHFSAHNVGSVSAAADEYHKVLLCHNGHEIRVDEHAVPAHLAQGDTFGPCPTYAPPMKLKANSKINLSNSHKNLVVIADKGSNKIKTGDGDDKVQTGAGNDKISVGKGNNKVDSGSGNDVIHTGIGHNTIFSGPGNDTIYVRNGRTDFVNCGPGTDTVYADPASVDFVAANCEIVHRAKFK